MHPLTSSARAEYANQCEQALLMLGERLSLDKGAVRVDDAEYAPRVEVSYGHIVLIAERVTTKRGPGCTLNKTTVTMRNGFNVHSVNVEALCCGATFHSTVRRLRATLNLPVPAGTPKRATRRYRFFAYRLKRL